MEADPWAVVRKYRYELLIVCAGIVVYFNMLFNGFVWDDLQYIVNYPLVHFVNIGLLLGPNIYNGGFFYRPVSALYFASMYTLFNGQPFYFHLLQLIIHIANGLLLFTLFSRFFKKTLSFCLALVFVIHPITTETVSYISAIDDPLCLFFGLIGMLVLFKNGVSSWKTKIIVTGCFLFLLLTKETGIILLLLGMLMSFLFKKKAFLTTMLMSGIAVLAYGVIRIATVGLPFSSPAPVPIAQASLLQRMYTMPLIFLYYLRTFFYPVYLAIDQQWVVVSPSVGNVYLPLLVVIFCIGAVLFGAYYLSQHAKEYCKPYVFFMVWFLLGIGMHMQVFPLEMTVADRWFYLPLVGLLGMLGSMYAALAGRYKKTHRVYQIVFVLLILLLGVRTITRNLNWSDPLTLYAHDEKVTNSYDLENSLATQLMQTGDTKGAFTHEERSVMLFPGQINQSNLAVLYERKGDLKRAETYFASAFSPVVDAMNGFHHDPRALVYYEEFMSVYGNPRQAMVSTQKALHEYPKLSELWTYLAIARYRTHNFQAAESAIDTAFSFASTEKIYSIKTQIYSHVPIETELLATGKKIEILE